MKANELRIGNWIQGEPISIPKLDMYGDGTMTITGQGIAFMEQGLYEGHYKPIPLTEEWLLKFGFEKNNDNCFNNNRMSCFIIESFVNISYKNNFLLSMFTNFKIYILLS
jgi:hypothetical protein